ncbi:Transcriptional regulatory protein ZraR [Rubripirellula tenax]|uniref:Transcriptional regulatory protein ZraR n=1 Tax=Rubripirellula tenax TaxID=2528015 RepID=A0A5C6F8E3_9BACT|nr:sigma-54 dependent transcriptional regulator [Rubripirellula tenax]TWU56880.1 Transcriptional regulatory protein ZraR [Rubripirellula tenax]
MVHPHGLSVKPKLLVACEGNSVVGSVHAHFTKWGYEVTATSCMDELLRRLGTDPPDLILLDLGEDECGFDVLNTLGQSWRSIPVIAMAPEATLGLAVRATKLGAVDVVANPPDLFQLRLLVDGAVRDNEFRSRSRRTEAGRMNSIKDAGNFGILGESQAIHDVLELVHDVAETDATVLILGESGTGKELLARAIHRCSARSNRPFVPVNVAALPATLSESILFGHEKGSYTGADTTSEGWCETADRGTLMLDEIGEMDIQLQAKLLRFLQDGTYMRVGSNLVRSADVRIIAATNREPEQMVRESTMRDDLYYRLNVFPIRMPPLRERRDDIPILAEAFLDKAVETHRRAVVGFSKDVMDCLVAYDWPGNVRQLENLVTRMVLLARDPYIGIKNVPIEIKSSTKPAEPITRVDSVDSGLSQMESLEKKAILAALRDTDGNAAAAAGLLGLGQATIYRKIKRFDIQLKQMKLKQKSAQ